MKRLPVKQMYLQNLIPAGILFSDIICSPTCSLNREMVHYLTASAFAWNGADECGGASVLGSNYFRSEAKGKTKGRVEIDFTVSRNFYCETPERKFCQIGTEIHTFPFQISGSAVESIV